MDVISFSKAMKAKKLMDSLNKRLGDGVQDVHANVKTRLEKLEEQDPHVTAYNRVSEVEANTAANLNKHNLRMNAVVNQNRYGLKEMAFDDFGDDTGIDKTKSTGFLFDAAGKKVKINTGQTQADVVTTVETVLTEPTMVVVSQASNLKTSDSKDADLTTGTLLHAELLNNVLQLKVIGNIDGGLGSVTAIPNMTANNVPSGLAIASSNAHIAHEVFDRTPSSSWQSAAKPTTLAPEWIGYQFPAPIVIGRYAVTEYVATDPARPKSFTFEGSNDNVSWEILDTFDGNTQSTWSGTLQRDIPNTAAYSYYRIKATDTYGTGAYVRIGDLGMIERLYKNLYEPTGSWESSVMDLGGNFKQLTNLNKVGYTPNIISATSIIPTMTGLTTPSGIASASSAWAGSEPWKAFDKVNSSGSYWHTAAGTQGQPAWIAYEFPAPRIITKYSMSPYSGSGYAVSNWTFEGWDGTKWIVLDTQTNVTGWVGYTKKEFTFQNSTPFIKYRINMAAAPSYIAYAEIEMFEALIATDVKLSTATSNDGVNFSAYSLIGTDGSITSPQGRYIKIKAEMTAGGQMGSKTLLDFVSNELSLFQADPQVVFDGSLKLKTSYSNAMVVDTSFVDGGTLLRKTLDKSLFKVIEKCEVI